MTSLSQLPPSRSLGNGGSRPSDRARHVATLANTYAAETESGGVVAGPVVDALHDTGLFRLLVPACMDGSEAAAEEAFEAIETLSHADGSTGWSFMAGAVYLGVAAAFLPSRGAAEVLGDPASVPAGQAAPLGLATRRSSGWQASGRFGFASGGRYATWFTGGFRELTADGEPVLDGDGRTPSMLVGYFPRSAVVVGDNWDVLGLVGTGSIDYEIDQELAADFTMSLYNPKLRRGPSRLAIGLSGLTAIGHSAFACGVAGRLLDELAALALAKRRLGRVTLVDDPQFQAFYARARGHIGSARSYAIECLKRWEDAAATGSEDPLPRAEGRIAASHAASAATRVAAEAFRFAGSAGLRNGSVLQRCFKDLNAGETHVFTDHNTFRDGGSLLLGVGSPMMLK